MNDSGEKIAAQEKDLALEWAREKDPQDRFTAFCVLPEGEKRKIFSYCVAGGIVGGLSGDMPPECEAIASRLKVQAHKEWRPNAAFFNRMTKAKLLSLAADIIGEERAAKLADLTRGGIAERLGSVFAGDALATSDMDAERLAYIATWLPEGMAYAEMKDAPLTGGVEEERFLREGEAFAAPDAFEPVAACFDSAASAPLDSGVTCVEIISGQPLPSWLLDGEAA